MNDSTTRGITVLTLMGLALLQTVGCASFQTLDKTKVATVSLAEFQADLVQKAEAWKIPADGIILKIAKGVSLPLKLKVATTFATIEPGSNRIRFERDIYLFIAPKGFKMSPDGERWVALGDWKKFNRLFGGRGGHFQVGFGVNRDEGPLVDIALGYH